ncbi:MAG: hypothetical protein EOP20_01930, partial [Hyphomicrobiales bacterium]
MDGLGTVSGLRNLSRNVGLIAGTLGMGTIFACCPLGQHWRERALIHLGLLCALIHKPCRDQVATEDRIVARDETNNRIALACKLIEEDRQHVDGALVNVVEENDAAATRIEPRHGSCSNRCGRILIVVLAVDIDIEHHGAALQEASAQEPRLREIGEAEEGRESLPTARECCRN